MSTECRRIRVRGVVQGVGFRPFIYRTAVGLGLAGSVRNLGDAGVEILVEGRLAELDAFVREVREEPPALAVIDSIDVEHIDPLGLDAFEILGSSEGGHGGGSLPPDVATCAACVEEILGPSRFHGYWATSCTDCGPRFTVIESLPYDRPRTAMKDFPMCVECHAEYTNPLDRRYHAQTTACEACGPVLAFDGDTHGAIPRTVRALRAGEIVAIKGLGGTHLACDATDHDAVGELRRRVGRPAQPYAIMGDLDQLQRVAEIGREEFLALTGPERPIVLLRSCPRTLAADVAPGLHTVGAMLPYSGLHHLLFAELDAPLVMTSANLPGRPMLIENEEIGRRLDGIADHFLLHDRRIVARCDDSVRRRVGDTWVFLRRSRGYVPQPIRAQIDVPTLALGPETDLTFAIAAEGQITLSQHIGSVDNLETLAYLRNAIDHLYRITHAPSPVRIACDLHPAFSTTRLADDLADRHGADVTRVQHHVAHLCSVMAEHDVEDAVGVILDGFGYGPDGTAWGGEILVGADRIVERAGHLRAVRLPGGDEAAHHPLRMAAALLHAAGDGEHQIAERLVARDMDAKEAGVICMQIARGLNAPWTTSAGRFLDAVAAWLGVCRTRTYEGEPAMRLEAAAVSGNVLPLEAAWLEEDGRAILDTAQLFRDLVELAKTSPVEDVAATAQHALAVGAGRIALKVAEATGISTIAFSGGVAYNDAIASALRRCVEAEGLTYVTNERVPCGDGGVSFGQAVFAGCGWRALEADGPDAAPGGRRKNEGEQSQK